MAAANCGSARYRSSPARFLIPALSDFERRNPGLTLRIEATHQYADFNASRVDVAIRYGREHSTGLKFEPLVEIRGLPVCAPALIKSGLRKPEDLSRQVLIHLTTQARAWPAWLKQAGIPQMTPRGNLWLDSVPGDAGSRGAWARRDARHGAADQVATGIRQEAPWRRSMLEGSPTRDDLSGVAHRAGTRPPHRRIAALDRGGREPRQPFKFRLAGSAASARAALFRQEREGAVPVFRRRIFG